MAIDLSQMTKDQLFDYQCQTRASVWAQRYTRLKGQNYRFARYLPGTKTLDLSRAGLAGQRQFLQQPLDDQHPWKSMQKSRQCGASENEVREVIWFADNHPYTKQIYVFPTFDQVSDFSKTRIETVMKDSPYLRDRMGFDPVTGKKKPGAEIDDAVRLRRIGDSFIFFRSGHTPKQGEGVDADVVRFDEIDRIHPGVLVAFNEGTSASIFGWRRDVSTPSLPGVGVNFSYSRSDQQYWWMTCPHCNHKFDLIRDFPKCVVKFKKGHNYHLKYPWVKEDDEYGYVCMKCRKLVSDETRIGGQWVADYPSVKRVRGYQISQLICPWISPTTLMNKRDEYKLEQLFVNYVIGLPYLGNNILLTEKDIMKSVDRSMTNPYELKDRDKVCMGVDWGNQSWGIVAMPHPDGSGRKILLDLVAPTDRQTLLISQAESQADNPHIRVIGDTFRQWRGGLLVADAGYGKDRNWQLKARFPARVYSCFYPNLSSDSTKTFDDAWNENTSTVNVDRTMTLKLMANEWVTGRWVVPGWVANNPLFPTFVKHMTNIVLIRNIEDDEKTKSEVITERVGTLPGGDHFAHACNYLEIALRHIKNQPGSDFIV